MKEGKRMEEMDLEIKDILKILKNRWKVIVGITTIITLIVVVMSLFVIKPVYNVSTKVFIGKDATKDVKYDSNDIEMYQKLLKTYSELIKTNDLIENVIDEKNLDITASAVNKTLVAMPRTDTQILEISYENNNNVLAKEVLEGIVDEFVKETKVLIPNGTVKVIETAKLPQYPVSPNYFKNISLSIFGGLIFGILLSFIMEYMDNTFKTKEQIEKVMGISVIGVIPWEDKKHRRYDDVHNRKENNKNLNSPACEN